MALTVQEIGQRAKRATNDVAHLSIAVRNNLLLEMAAALLEQQHAIIVANQEDLAEFATQLSEPMQHRLTLDEKLIRDISQSMAAVAKLPDQLQALLMSGVHMLI